MARRLSLLVSSALVFALVACGGASDAGLFSGSGASGGNPGAAAGADTAGGSAVAGDGSTPPNQGGASAEGGNVGVAGQASGGIDATGGSNAAGGGNAGSAAGGTAGTVDHAGAGGISAGSGGSAGGAGGSLAGSAGSSAGSGGMAATCKELLAQAATQLEAASACDLSRNAQQCTGKVKTTCDCETPVENENSPEAQAYEATLKQITQKKCVTICPAIACIAVNHAQCRANSVGSTAGTCVSSFAATPF